MGLELLGALLKGRERDLLKPSAEPSVAAEEEPRVQLASL